VKRVFALDVPGMTENERNHYAGITRVARLVVAG
jgi:hypothetical protein